jgi:hypothetical protein
LKEQATPADTIVSPWANAVTTATATPLALDKTDGVNVDRAGLARALLQWIWTAGQTYQPKASRDAAARWSSDILKDLDLLSACHITSFQAGDSTVTASSAASPFEKLKFFVSRQSRCEHDDTLLERLRTLVLS